MNTEVWVCLKHFRVTWPKLTIRTVSSQFWNLKNVSLRGKPRGQTTGSMMTVLMSKGHQWTAFCIRIDLRKVSRVLAQFLQQNVWHAIDNQLVKVMRSNSFQRSMPMLPNRIQVFSAPREKVGAKFNCNRRVENPRRPVERPCHSVTLAFITCAKRNVTGGPSDPAKHQRVTGLAVTGSVKPWSTSIRLD